MSFRKNVSPWYEQKEFYNQNDYISSNTCCKNMFFSNLSIFHGYIFSILMKDVSHQMMTNYNIYLGRGLKNSINFFAKRNDFIARFLCPIKQNFTKNK